MNKLQHVFAFLALGSVASLASGCDKGPKPEKVCDEHMATRKKDAWPADDKVKAACVKDLESLKKKDEKKYAEVTACLYRSSLNGPSGINACLSHMGEDYEDGFVAHTAGAWADDKPKKLDEEMCNEGAYVIAHHKQEMKILKDDAATRSHEIELAKACKEQKTIPAYATMFACMRKATKADDLMKCNGQDPTAGPDGTSANVIEACVSDCSAKNGREPTPAYMACFNACKAAGGP